jgi:hypothetical protein
MSELQQRQCGSEPDAKSQTQPKFTPGPWRVDDDVHAHVIDSEYHVIDAGPMCTPAGFSLAGCMTLANAHLIAAAPEMYEALKAICDSIATWDWDKADAFAALAKAEGRVR